MEGELRCPACSYVGVPRLRFVPYRAAGREHRHLRADCGACGRYLQFVPQGREPWRTLAMLLELSGEGGDGP